MRILLAYAGLMSSTGLEGFVEAHIILRMSLQNHVLVLYGFVQAHTISAFYFKTQSCRQGSYDRIKARRIEPSIINQLPKYLPFKHIQSSYNFKIYTS